MNTQWPKEDKIRAMKLRKKAWTFDEISIDIGIPKSTIYKWTKDIKKKKK